MSYGPSSARLASQWLLGAILAVFLSLTFLMIIAAQLTSRDTGERILRRAAATITEIDQILPAIEEGLTEAETSATPVARVPHFPIPVDLTQEEAATLRGSDLRSRLLEEAGRQLYGQGNSAWAGADAEARQSIDTFSRTGVVHRSLGLITAGQHDRFVIAALVLGALSAVLAVMLMLTVHSYTKLVALGGAILAASVPSLVAAVALRIGFEAADNDSDPFVSGLLAIGSEVMGVAIADYIALSVLGIGSMVVGVLFLGLRARAERYETPQTYEIRTEINQ